MNILMPAAARMSSVALASLLLIAADPMDAATPADVGWSWPSLDRCEPWPDPADAGRTKPARGPAARHVVAALTDPVLAIGIDFVSRNIRYGGIVVDGRRLDTSVPPVTAHVRGRALIDAGDSLAYVSLAEGPWARAELRRADDGEAHEPYLPAGWAPLDEGTQRAARLPESLRTVTGVSPTARPPAGRGTWYDVHTGSVIPPGTMWDTTRDVFPVIRDPRSALRVAVDAKGRPLIACLAQRWWQGYDGTLGEDAELLTVIRFVPATASGVPDTDATLVPGSVPELELELAAPVDWETDYDEATGSYWMWRDDEDGLPSILINRRAASEEMLDAIGDASLADVLTTLAQLDAQDATGAWSDGPASNEPTTLGGTGGAGPVVPARMLVFHPRFTDIGLHTVVDTIAWVSPYQYLFQMTTAVEDEVPDRYVLDRVLGTIRFTGAPPSARPARVP